MKDIPDGSVDMVLCDPPYSSGGLFAGDRKASTRTKYCDGDYNGCEYVVWGTNGARTTEYRPGVFIGAGCYRVKSVNTKNKHHQTEKPVELLENLLAICPAGGVALDPFMGSGSTGVACVKTGRKFIGMELDPGYFEIAKRRIKEAQRKNEM